jgi:hypothetical protein
LVDELAPWGQSAGSGGDADLMKDTGRYLTKDEFSQQMQRVAFTG